MVFISQKQLQPTKNSNGFEFVVLQAINRHIRSKIELHC